MGKLERVIVREWDPGSASTADLEAVRCVLNDAFAVDLPGDPPYQPNRFRDYLAATMPGERRFSWLGQLTPDGPPDGHASILLLDDIGVLELVVRPAARRAGLGHALLAQAARHAAAEGFGAIGVEVIAGTAAVSFYEELDFRCTVVEMRNILDLSGVDWLRLGEMAGGIGAGYRIEYHPGGPPESVFAAYAATKEAERDTGAVELRPSSYDAERLQASLSTLHARGLKPYIVLAVHEATETIAGLTEVVVPAQRPTRADQYDTVVLEAHRGYGVDRALKARMLFELRAAEPQLVEVQTWNEFENDPMLNVNRELGFRPDREWREYEADVVDLLRTLKV